MVRITRNRSPVFSDSRNTYPCYFTFFAALVLVLLWFVFENRTRYPFCHNPYKLSVFFLFLYTNFFANFFNRTLQDFIKYLSYVVGVLIFGVWVVWFSEYIECNKNSYTYYLCRYMVLKIKIKIIFNKFKVGCCVHLAYFMHSISHHPLFIVSIYLFGNSR